MEDSLLAELSPEAGLGLVFLACAAVVACLLFFWLISASSSSASRTRCS